MKNTKTKNDFLKGLTIGVLAIALIVSMTSSKGNIEKGIESVDVTEMEYINVGTTTYTDLKRFRINNTESDTIGLWVVLRSSSDTVYGIFRPGWNPEVVIRIVANTAYTDTTILIGK